MMRRYRVVVVLASFTLNAESHTKLAISRGGFFLCHLFVFGLCGADEATGPDPAHGEFTMGVAGGNTIHPGTDEK